MTAWLLLAVLATYRVARMIASEDGPFEVFLHLRSWAHRRGGWIARGTQCILCLSFWLAWLAALLVPLERPQTFVLFALATAGGVVVIKRTLDLVGGA